MVEIKIVIILLIVFFGVEILEKKGTTLSLGGDEESSNNVVRILIPIMLFLIFVGIPLVLYLSVFNSYGFSTFNDDWGAFGDYLGGFAGTLLSFIAVMLIYYTYISQREEIKITNSALKSQYEQMQMQQQTQMLFNILDRKDKFIDNLTFEVVKDSSKVELHGMKALNAMYLYLTEKLVEIQNKHGSNSKERKEFLTDFFLSEAYQFAQYTIAFKSSIEYFDNIKATNGDEQLTKHDLIRLYSSYFTVEEESIINKIFEFYWYKEHQGELDDRRIETLENLMERVHELDIINLSDINKQSLGLVNK